MDSFLRLIESTKVLPEEIMVSNEELFMLLLEVADALGINLTRPRDLPAVSGVKAMLMQSLAR